jgi:hypothetical protein
MEIRRDREMEFRRDREMEIREMERWRDIKM